MHSTKKQLPVPWSSKTMVQLCGLHNYAPLQFISTVNASHSSLVHWSSSWPSALRVRSHTSIHGLEQSFKKGIHNSTSHGNPHNACKRRSSLRANTKPKIKLPHVMSASMQCTAIDMCHYNDNGHLATGVEIFPSLWRSLRSTRLKHKYSGFVTFRPPRKRQDIL